MVDAANGLHVWTHLERAREAMRSSRKLIGDGRASCHESDIHICRTRLALQRSATTLRMLAPSSSVEV